MKRKIIIMLCLGLLLFTISSKTFAKYVISSESVEIIKINKIGIQDKIFDEINISATDSNDNGSSFTIQANDYISGIERIELYINNSLYRTFDYSSNNYKSRIENFDVGILDIPFYENCYAKGIDKKGNEKTSNLIVPNTSRIRNLTDLLKFRQLQNDKIVNFEGKDLYLLNNVELSGEWTPIGSLSNPFKGRFHGYNYEITNLQITVGHESNGFFGTIDGEISDLIVKGNINLVGGLHYAGGIAGTNGGTIHNCKNYVNISGDSSSVGGITGVCSYTGKSLISNCINYGNISGYECVGGICGFNYGGYVEKCGNSSNTTITATFQCGGGILGYADAQQVGKDSVAKECYNKGTVTGGRAIAGILGGGWSGDFYEFITIKYCYNTGTINCDNIMNGGILGGTQYDWSSYQVTNPSYNTIIGCYNVGKINSSNPNQISRDLADVRDSYYIMGNANISKYGKAIVPTLAKANENNANSLISLLKSVQSGIWTKNSLNDGYPCFLWENEQ